MLEKRQALEEKKFRLQQEESRLNLEAEIAKTSAKEKAFAALTTPSLSPLKPIKLESRFDDKDFSYAPPIEKPAVEKLHYADHDFQSTSAYCGPPVRLEEPTADQDFQRETITLQHPQTDLQHQQNRIVEMLAQNQNRSKLPQPRVPVFDGNPTLMSRNARDDKNGRFGERAPQLTMLAKLAILAIFCQFRQIS